MEELIANILVPIIVLLSNYFFHSWAVLISIFLTSFLLNKIIRPQLADMWGDLGFLKDFKEKIGFKFLLRTFLFSAIICYVSASFIVFLTLKSHEYLQDNNIPGIFINREIFIFLASLTPMAGMYSTYKLIKYKIDFKGFDLEFFIAHEFQSKYSFNAFTCGLFLSSIICLIIYLALKINPQLMELGWPWVEKIHRNKLIW